MVYMDDYSLLTCLTSQDKLAMVASTVSSKMLKAMAKRENFKYVECLTGFKYIGNTALDMVKQGHEVICFLLIWKPHPF